MPPLAGQLFFVFSCFFGKKGPTEWIERYLAHLAEMRVCGEGGVVGLREEPSIDVKPTHVVEFLFSRMALMISCA